MEHQLQSLGILLCVVLLASSIPVWLRSRHLDREDARRRQEQILAVIMDGRNAAARMLYGEYMNWGRLAMEHYDTDPDLREQWLEEADRRLGRATVDPASPPRGTNG